MPAFAAERSESLEGLQSRHSTRWLKVRRNTNTLTAFRSGRAYEPRPGERRRFFPMPSGIADFQALELLQREQILSPKPSLQNFVLQHRQARSAATSPRAFATLKIVSVS